MLNIPNILSAFRIALVPLFMWRFSLSSDAGDYTLTAAILVTSGVTDILDGYIARKYNMITLLGKILDPVADKLTLFAVCICLWSKFPELWFIFMFFIGKEIVIMSASVFLINKKIELDGAKWFGKLYTVIFYVVTTTVILFPQMRYFHSLALLGIMLIFTMFSLGMYIPVFLKLKNSGNTKIDEKTGGKTNIS